MFRLIHKGSAIQSSHGHFLVEVHKFPCRMPSTGNGPTLGPFCTYLRFMSTAIKLPWPDLWIFTFCYCCECVLEAALHTVRGEGVTAQLQFCLLPFKILPKAERMSSDFLLDFHGWPHYRLLPSFPTFHTTQTPRCPLCPSDRAVQCKSTTCRVRAQSHVHARSSCRLQVSLADCSSLLLLIPQTHAAVCWVGFPGLVWHRACSLPSGLTEADRQLPV